MKTMSKKPAAKVARTTTTTGLAPLEDIALSAVTGGSDYDECHRRRHRHHRHGCGGGYELKPL